MDVNIPASLIESLKLRAKGTCWGDEDDFNPFERSGGNFDDAYEGGYDDGLRRAAREILDAIGIQY